MPESSTFKLSPRRGSLRTIQKNPLSGRVSIITGGVVDYINAGEAEIKGVEFDFLLLPMPELNPGLVVTGGPAYIDARYTEFVNGRGYDDATGLAFGEGGATLPPRDLSGNRIPRVPELSWVAAINQRIDLDGGHALEFGVDTSYASEMFFLPQNSEFSKRDALQLYNARASWLYEPWALELTAYVSNITDEIYAETAFVSDFGSSLTVNNDPRMYGLRARISF
ncbi:TonB-dependent receptor domain-containing protein [Sinimarinibacterium thermocellulolyticum]|uniref:TonB-dependent receptor domain-containing protein n=1 Tax=Sinimarinibacterium thermocellulolyticum TaxID=3170016 RepID=UPI00333BABB5